MGTILPPPEIVFFDANGNPLAAGTVQTLVPNTTTSKQTWQDAASTILNTNPIVLDAAGRAIVYGSGTYRFIVRDSAGNLIYDQVTSDTAGNGLGWGGTSTGTPNAQVIAASNFTQQDGQQISFIVGPGLTNTSGLTVAPGGGSGIPVLQDLQAGPTPLVGGEVVAGNAVTLIFDQARGAFHLLSEPAPIPPNSFADGSFRIQNTSDITKQIAFDASAIATGTTRTLTAPNANITIADAAMGQGYLFGCTLSNDAVTPASVLDIAAGQARNSTNVDNLILTSAVTKNTSASWAVGSGNGSLDTGTIGNNTYHVFLIMRTDTRVVDVLTSLSATNPTLPANYTLFRRIGSIIRTAGSIQLFVQDGDRFTYTAASLTADYSGGSRAKSNLSVNVPTGIRVYAKFSINISGNGSSVASTAHVFDGTNTNSVVSFGVGTNGAIVSTASGTLEQFTNQSAQVQLSWDNSGGNMTTIGFLDTRGR